MSIKDQPERGEIKAAYPMWRHNFLGYLLRVAGWWVVFFFVGLLLLGGVARTFGTAISQAQNEGFILPLSLLLSIWMNARVRIVIRENGLEYHGLFGAIFDHFRPRPFSTWENLSHIGLDKYSDDEGGVGHQCRLYLKHPIGESFHIGKIFSGRGIFALESWYEEGDLAYIYIHELTRTNFGQMLQTYAPHVIEETSRNMNSF